MSGHQFPRSSRICRKADFEEVFSKGVRWSTRHLRAVVHEAGRDESRLGLAVSRKVGNAVVRNRLKRRLREIFRVERSLAPAHRDLILIPRPGCSDLDFQKLRLEVIDLISRSVDSSGEPRPSGESR